MDDSNDLFASLDSQPQPVRVPSRPADPLVQAILEHFPGSELRVVEKIETPPVEAYLDAIRDEDEDDE